MKGIILAGGTGSRLYPLTKITNKHLLPVFNKPMVYYPLYAMKEAGITNVLIISGKGHTGDFLELLGSGAEIGMKLSYEIQDEAGGIAQALGLAEGFVSNDKMMVVLGDNVFGDSLKPAVEQFKAQPRGAHIFLKSVVNPSSYGVAELADDRILSIIEKPADPKTDLAVTGCYLYDPQVFDVIRGLRPSNRNELEITDVNNFYLEQGTLRYSVLKEFWGDCGESFASLMEASNLVKNCYLANVGEHLDLLEREHREIWQQELKSVELPA